MMEFMDFAERVQHILQIRGLKERELSDAAGLTSTHINRILTTRAKPKLATIEKIAAAAGVRVAWLASGEGDPDSASSDHSDPLGGDPKVLARDSWSHRAVDNGADPDQVREFIAAWDTRAYSGAQNTLAWWESELADAWRKWRAAAKGKGGPFGVGAREG